MSVALYFNYWISRLYFIRSKCIFTTFFIACYCLVFILPACSYFFKYSVPTIFMQTSMCGSQVWHKKVLDYSPATFILQTFAYFLLRTQENKGSYTELQWLGRRLILWPNVKLFIMWLIFEGLIFKRLGYFTDFLLPLDILRIKLETIEFNNKIYDFKWDWGSTEMCAVDLDSFHPCKSLSSISVIKFQLFLPQDGNFVESESPGSASEKCCQKINIPLFYAQRIALAVLKSEVSGIRFLQTVVTLHLHPERWLPLGLVSS